MTAYSAVHAPAQVRQDVRSTPFDPFEVADTEHTSDLLRGIGFGLAFVAPFWTAVAVVLVRVL